MEPLIVILERRFITEGENNSHVGLEIFVRFEHATNDVSHKPVLITGSNLSLDHPKDLGDLLLLSRHLVIARKPDWKRHSEVKQTREICKRKLVVVPHTFQGLEVLCDTLDAAFGSKCGVITHQSVEDSALAMAEGADDKVSLV